MKIPRTPVCEVRIGDLCVVWEWIGRIRAIGRVGQKASSSNTSTVGEVWRNFLKSRVVARYKGYTNRKVVTIHEREVVESLFAIGATSEKELSKCDRSVALYIVSAL